MTVGVSHGQGSLLAQLRPSGTTAVQLFQSDTLITELTLLFAQVRAGEAGTVDVTVYHDDDGTTYDDDSVIFLDQRTRFASPSVFQARHPGSGILLAPGGSIGVQSSIANAVNFSLYGITETLAERIQSQVR